MQLHEVASNIWLHIMIHYDVGTFDMDDVCGQHTWPHLLTIHCNL